MDNDPDRFYKRVADWIMNNDRLLLQWKNHEKFRDEMREFYESGQYQMMYQCFFYDYRKQDSYYWALIDLVEDANDITPLAGFEVLEKLIEKIAKTSKVSPEKVLQAIINIAQFSPKMIKDRIQLEMEDVED